MSSSTSFLTQNYEDEWQTKQKDSNEQENLKKPIQKQLSTQQISIS
jgi:hypothetical protein